MTTKKWYIVETYTDTECEVKVIDLTDEEYKTIKRFINNDNVIHPVVYPYLIMISIGYDTYDNLMTAYKNGAIDF
jgi:hypothetical protein